MPVPKAEKEVRDFLGSINYMWCFIAKHPVACEPLFKLLRKNKLMV